LPGLHLAPNNRTNPVFDVPVGRSSVVACGNAAKGMLALRGAAAPRRGWLVLELRSETGGGAMNGKATGTRNEHRSMASQAVYRVQAAPPVV